VQRRPDPSRFSGGGKDLPCPHSFPSWTFVSFVGKDFQIETRMISGNRAVVLWVYRKMRCSQPWHIHGVDIFTVRDGKVAAKLVCVCEGLR